MIYKGITLTQDMLNYISTYRLLDDDNLESYLDDDKPLQRMILIYKAEITLYKIAFNLGIYAMFYSVYILIKGCVPCYEEKNISPDNRNIVGSRFNFQWLHDYEWRFNYYSCCILRFGSFTAYRRQPDI